jgi:hypothetical protein
VGNGILATIHVQSLAYFGDLSMGLASAIWPRFGFDFAQPASLVGEGAAGGVRLALSHPIWSVGAYAKPIGLRQKPPID